MQWGSEDWGDWAMGMGDKGGGLEGGDWAGGVGPKELGAKSWRVLL